MHPDSVSSVVLHGATHGLLRAVRNDRPLRMFTTSVAEAQPSSSGSGGGGAGTESSLAAASTERTTADAGAATEEGEGEGEGEGAEAEVCLSHWGVRARSDRETSAAMRMEQSLQEAMLGAGGSDRTRVCTDPLLHALCRLVWSAASQADGDPSDPSGGRRGAVVLAPDWVCVAINASQPSWSSLRVRVATNVSSTLCKVIESVAGNDEGEQEAEAAQEAEAEQEAEQEPDVILIPHSVTNKNGFGIAWARLALRLLQRPAEFRDVGDPLAVEVATQGAFATVPIRFLQRNLNSVRNSRWAGGLPTLLAGRRRHWFLVRMVRSGAEGLLTASEWLTRWAVPRDTRLHDVRMTTHKIPATVAEDPRRVCVILPQLRITPLERPRPGVGPGVVGPGGGTSAGEFSDARAGQAAPEAEDDASDHDEALPDRRVQEVGEDAVLEYFQATLKPQLDDAH